MRTFNGKIFMVFSAVLLTAGVTVWLYHRSTIARYGALTTDTDLQSQEQQILEAVFTAAIQNSEVHPSSSLFFVSKEDDKDPDAEVLTRLQRRGFRVKPLSKSTDERSVIKDKDTGDLGIVLRAAEIKWTDKNNVEVPVSYYSGWGDVKGYVYHMTGGENGWVVSDRKFAFES